jgi:hypothetical protein
VAGKRPDLLARGAIPEPEGAVEAARGEVPAVGAEGHRMNELAVVTGDRTHFPGGSLEVPELQESRAGKGHLATVGAEGHAIDARSMPRNPLDERAGCRIPERGVADLFGRPELPVPRDDPSAVRAIRQAEERQVAVTAVGQAGPLRAGVRVPDDHVGGVARGDPAAVGTEGHAPEAAGDVAIGEDLLTSRHVADDQISFQ